MLNNIFPLHTKTQNYHVKYPSSTPMYCAKCHNANNFPPKKVIYVDK